MILIFHKVFGLSPNRTVIFLAVDQFVVYNGRVYNVLLGFERIEATSTTAAAVS